MNALKVSVVLAIALAAVPVRAEQTLPPPKPAPVGTLYYDILLGEIAGKRGDLDQALRAYLDAASRSDDVRVAERAFGLALYAGHPALGVDAARRWFALAPDDPQARQALVLALVDAGQVNDAVAHLEVVRESLAGRDRQQGFAALAGLLNQVPNKRAVYLALAELRARHPEYAAGYYYEAAAALAAGEQALVLPLLDAAIRAEPQWVPAHLLRARALLDRGDIDAARAALAAAVQRFPDDGKLRMDYARVLYTAGEADAALVELERVIGADPLDVEARLAFGAIAIERRQYARAVQVLEPALESGGRDDEVMFELGQAEEGRGDFARAAEWYGRVSSDTRAFAARIRIGGLRLRESGPDAMRAYFDAQRREHPDDARRLYLGEADLLRREDRFGDAMGVLDGALAALPDDTDMLYARALVAERLDRIDQAEADLRRVLQLDPDNAMALNALGYTLADRGGRYAEALPFVERALARTPDDAATLDSMGWILFKIGRAEEGLDYLRRARARSDEPEITAHLVEVLQATGRGEEARTLFERAWRLTPDDRFLRRLKEVQGW